LTLAEFDRPKPELVGDPLVLLVDGGQVHEEGDSA